MSLSGCSAGNICLYPRLFVKSKKGLRQYIYLCFVSFFRSFVSFDILSEWFMVILYKSNCHLLLWSACTSKRADAEAYVNKSFCQLVFYTRIERERISSHWLSTSCMRFVCLFCFVFLSSISNQQSMLFYVQIFWCVGYDHISSFLIISLYPIAFLK